MRSPLHSLTMLMTRLGFRNRKSLLHSNAYIARKLHFEQCEDRRLLAILVDVTHDISDPLDGKTTLREAIFEANIGDDPDEINFDSTVFNTPQTIFLTQGELSITEAVTIDTEGQKITVDASNANAGFKGTFYLN